MENQEKKLYLFEFRYIVIALDILLFPSILIELISREIEQSWIRRFFFSDGLCRYSRNIMNDVSCILKIETERKESHSQLLCANELWMKNY